MAETAQWESDICGCCSVKDCGCGCCCKLYCTSPCIWGAAMEKAGLGSMPLCCFGCIFCPVCVMSKGRIDVAAKYGIQEGAPMAIIQTCCCPSCSAIQVLNQVHVSTVPNHLKIISFSFQMSPPWSNMAYLNPRTHGYSAELLSSTPHRFLSRRTIPGAALALRHRRRLARPRSRPSSARFGN